MSVGELSVADFAFCGILGEGEFGRVMMARKNHTSEVSMEEPFWCRRLGPAAG